MCVTKMNSKTQKKNQFLFFFSKLWSPISMAVQVRVWSPGAEIPIYNIVTHTWPSFLVSQASTTVYQKEHMELQGDTVGVPAMSQILTADSQKLSLSILRKVPFLIF